MERCKTCRWWLLGESDMYSRPSITGYHFCTCPKICEAWNHDGGAMDELVYEYDESGGFEAGPEFGCVHHEKREEP